MQDRYAFDLGDFSKFGLLRALSGVGPLAVLWYRNEHLTAAERCNGDGCHREHLDPADARFAGCDEPLRDAMRTGFGNGFGDGRMRTVARLQDAGCLMPEPTWIGAPLPPRGAVAGRQLWFAAALDACAGCALVCCDPDNGIARPGSLNERRASPKHLRLTEAEALVARGHSLVLYHSFARRPHDLQMTELRTLLQQRLGLPVTVLRWGTIAPRAYAVVAQDRHRTAIAAGIARLLASPWGRHFQFRGALAEAAAAG